MRDRADARAESRVWLAALGRLALFGLLFVLLAEVLGTLAGLTMRGLAPDPLPEGGWPARSVRVAVGGGIWLIAALVAGIVALRRLDGRSWRALGITPDARAARDSASALLFGVALLLLAVVPLLVGGLLRFAGDAGGGAGWAASLAVGLAVLALPAAAEEVLFRGYVFQVLARAGGTTTAVLATSLAFALLHGGNPEVGRIALANIFVAGVWLALVYVRTASLWAATAAHLGWNWAMAVALDLPVSGLDWLDTPLYDAMVGGPAWLSGGRFGPEGGLVATIALALGALAMWRVPGRSAASLAPAERPLFMEEPGRERPEDAATGRMRSPEPNEDREGEAG